MCDSEVHSLEEVFKRFGMAVRDFFEEDMPLNVVEKRNIIIRRV